MNLKKLGGHAYRLTKDYGPQTDKPKTPANKASLTFIRNGADILIIKGSLMLSKAEVLKEIIVK